MYHCKRSIKFYKWTLSNAKSLEQLFQHKETLHDLSYEKTGKHECNKTDTIYKIEKNNKV